VATPQAISGWNPEQKNKSTFTFEGVGPAQIRFNSLDPGQIETEGTQGQGVLESDFRDSEVKNTPLGRIGPPEDIGPIAVFLVSDAAFWVNGSKILAGGGVSM
jgi:3-oxoacyl-[acyl-carrier protein] reductase